MANHHYVPQLYLKRFCDPDTPAGQEPYLWVSARSGTNWKKRAPKNVGAKAGLYAIPTHGGDDEMVEKMFSTIESKMASIYKRRFDLYSAPVGREEREVFALFVALFAIRSPFYRRNIADFSQQVAEMGMRMMARKPEIVERTFREVEKTTGQKPLMTVAEYQDIILKEKVKLEAAPHFVTTMALQQLPLFAELIYLMRWRFLVAPAGAYFATGDSPAHWQDLTPRPPMFRGHGLAMKNVEIVLPLSRKLCFVGRWSRSTGVVMATPAQVREITNRTISWSDKETYSPKPFTKVKIDSYASTPLYPLASTEKGGFVPRATTIANERREAIREMAEDAEAGQSVTARAP